ncbi:cytochrome [Streptomyces cellostaticus]|uniref:Cytochrome n=1 Tax=Streptomyces cellostaticus TaxID=67285 RepID=A0A101NNH8_9ACTN|nr:cytochrome P450 [Streptomyces cellostaticus]KUM96504.1 cytochrome [Streptomyces cellostaticus]GHI08972.1 cytochrome P450 [Streptomyces cellostaticus]
MTPEPQHLTGTDPAPSPPPGCPAHGPGPGGLHRLYGPDAADLGDLYERLREEHGPVAPVLLHDDVPMWVVLGHAENLHLVRSPSQYARDSRIWTPLQEGMVKPDHPLMPHIAWQPICSHAEGDEHQRLRAAVTGAMSTIDHRNMRRHIGRYTQELVNDFCERGRADLVSQFAEHLPMAVMCELLGMPEEYNDRMVQAARDALKGTETAIQSHAYVMDALSRLTTRRRARPDDDFTSHLITHPAGLTDDEVREHLRLVLFAAYEATANLLANALRMVLTEPGFRAKLNGGQMTVPEAIEQSLWDEPPFSTVLGYFAKQDTELGGQRIRKGDGLLFAPAPGNVDPRVRPDLSANMQGNRSHLAFGGGPHECPGQDIGRAIADVGVDALLMRLSDIQLDCPEEDLSWRSSIASRHLVALPVRFEPKPQQDVQRPPSPSPIPSQRATWQVGSLRTDPAPAAEPRPTAPPPAPEPAVAPQPARRANLWQRMLRWWRGD